MSNAMALKLEHASESSGGLASQFLPERKSYGWGWGGRVMLTVWSEPTPAVGGAEEKVQ